MVDLDSRYLSCSLDYINGFHDTANAISYQRVDASYIAEPCDFDGGGIELFGCHGQYRSCQNDWRRPGSGSDPNQLGSYYSGFGRVYYWNILTWYYRIPSSSSHSLIGGIIGAVSISVGPQILSGEGIGKIVLSLVLSPVVALVTGYFVMIGLLWVVRNYSPVSLNRQFRRMQIASASLMAFSHGSNDAQKAMGIIALALLSGGYIDTMEIPTWVKLACATSMALGTSAGGWRIISTMGTKIF